MGIADNGWGREAILPELSLIVAVVQGAAEDLAGPLHHETMGWFHKDDRNTPYSFYWCCDMLNLDPARIRTAILKNPDRSLIVNRAFGETKPCVDEIIPSKIGKGLCLLCGWNVGIESLVCTPDNGGSKVCVRRNPTGAAPARKVGPCCVCGTKDRVKRRRRKTIRGGMSSLICDSCFEDAKPTFGGQWMRAVRALAELGGGPNTIQQIIEVSKLPEPKIRPYIGEAAKDGYLLRLKHGVYGMTSKGWAAIDEENACNAS